MSKSAYRNLQRHLDRQAVGWPSAPLKSDQRLLRRLFTIGQAALATALDYRFRTLAEIEERCRSMGIPTGDLADELGEMVRRGLIGLRREEGQGRYAIIPLIVGIYEAQVGWLTREFLDDFHDYTSTISFGLAFLNGGIQQMRTIPVEESLAGETGTLPYDDIRAIVENAQGPFVINECICRNAREAEGDTCRVTSRRETCLALDSMAEQCIEMGIGRIIEKGEALRILRENQKEGLVLQPSNTQKVEFVCSCCGCCCGMLRIQKRLPVPMNFWHAGYYAVVEESSCVACGICLDRCQVGALLLDGESGTVRIDRRRCVGCGNCVPSCMSRALSLEKNGKAGAPPENTDDLYDMLRGRKKGIWGNLVFALKNLFFNTGG